LRGIHALPKGGPCTSGWPNVVAWMTWSAVCAVGLRGGRVDLDLVEPTGADGGRDLNGIRVPFGKGCRGSLPAMGGAVIGDPEDTVGRAIGLLLHDQVDQVVEGVDAGGGPTEADHFGPSDVPGGEIGEGALALIAQSTRRQRPGVGWPTEARFGAWILVFSSAQMTQSSGRRGLPCQRRWYRSSTRPPRSAKQGSRGQIQLR
jgi:hypothetical protein